MNDFIDTADEDMPAAAPKTIADFLVDFGKDDKFEVELSIREYNQIVFFHSHAFSIKAALFEFDLTQRILTLVFEEGSRQVIGKPLPETVPAQMQNAHQILMVLIDPRTGEIKNGHYVPLILLSA